MSRTVANAILRAHRQQAERIDANLDRRARLHEADEQDYYERDKSDSVNAAYVCAVLVAALIVGGAIVRIVEWVGG